MPQINFRIKQDKINKAIVEKTANTHFEENTNRYL